ncbi:MAG: hypothetical protein V3V01_16050 [Acidimicrobiales bacterium]
MNSARLSYRWLFAASTLVFVMFVSACSTATNDDSAAPTAVAFSDEEPATSTPISPAQAAVSPTTTAAPTIGCIGTTFSVNYPESWFVGSTGSIETCRFFSRRAIAPTIDGKYAPEIVIVRERRYESVLGRVSNFAGNATRLLDSRASDVNGYPATIFDVASNGQGSFAEGLRTRVVVVNLDGKALVATATEATVGPPAGDFDETIRVLDRILKTLIIIE